MDIESYKWNNWEWQLSNAINSFEQLKKFSKIDLNDSLELNSTLSLPFSITPYIASLLSSKYISKQFLPQYETRQSLNFDSNDYLCEDKFQPVPNMIHKYPNRVALFVTNYCAAYCRHCTRRRRIGKNYRINELNKAIEYISNHKEINDVLITGGDPLILKDEILDELLKRLSSISHVRLLRIGTRTPISLPMRITNELISMLKKYQPLYINIHINHPDELTAEAINSIKLLADAGFPLGSQTVLLKNINDDIKTLEKLFTELTCLRIKPYYIYECDRVSGCENFWVDPRVGKKLIDSINGKLSGMAVPKFVIDMPGEFGKQIIAPCNLINIDEHKLKLINYKNEIESYSY